MGVLSNLFGLLASVMLFIPLWRIAGLADSYRRLGNLGEADGVEDEDVRHLRKQISDEVQSISQRVWLVVAGICFMLAFLFMALDQFRPA